MPATNDPYELLAAITLRIKREADRAFDYETAMDSDGTDQAQRDGLLEALDIVKHEFAKRGVR